MTITFFLTHLNPLVVRDKISGNLLKESYGIPATNGGHLLAAVSPRPVGKKQVPRPSTRTGQKPSITRIKKTRNKYIYTM